MTAISTNNSALLSHAYITHLPYPLTMLQLSKLNPLLSLARFGQICCYIMYTIFTDLFGVVMS